MKSSFHRVLLSLLVPLFFVPRVRAADAFDFAEYLFGQEEYYRAISEYQRFMYFHSSDSRVSRARFRTGMAYYRAGRYQNAYDSFSLLAGDREFSYPARFLMGDCRFRMDQFDLALVEYSGLATSDLYTEQRPEVLMRMSWAEMMRREFGRTMDLYDRIIDEYPGFNRAGDIQYLRESVENLDSFKKRSPGLAALMSAVLPGSGQMYTRRPGDGLVAFGLVAGLTVASYYLWTAYDYPEIAFAVTALDAFVYAGNVYSAYASARKYNIMFFRTNLGNLRKNFWYEYEP